MVLQNSAFSEDGKYFAQICTDGKIKIWNTLSNSLEQEYTPDYHLTTPCTCLGFWGLRRNNKNSPLPKKKKKRDEPHLIFGTASGVVLIYSITKGCVEYSINSNINSQINCLSVIDNILYSGADQNVLEWNLNKRELISHWKSGNETITSVLAIGSKRVLTASKIIKLWNVDTKKVVETFTGHSSNIITMHYIDLTNSGSYILSGSKADRLLSCWKLNTENKQKNAVCNYLMQDVIQNISINISMDGLTSVAATNKSGAVHIFQHRLNGKCDKPIKPRTTFHVVSDIEESNETVKPIKIFGANFLDSQTLSIGHGSEVVLTFENVPLSTQRVEVLIRKDPYSIKKSKDEQVTKIKEPVVGEDVQYISYDVAGVPAKRKSGIEAEIPMEQRLENLTLSKLEGKVPKVNNVAQLLLQGLHSKDRNILRTALWRKDEVIIKNTIRRLPVTVFEPLITEIGTLIRGKTVQSKFGALWLKHLVQIHAGVLLSNPNLSEMFGNVLGNVHNRINSQISINKLRGKLQLLLPKVVEQENVEDEEAPLVFNDKDSSDSESEQESILEIASDSEPENWDEDENMEVEDHEDAASNSDDDSVLGQFLRLAAFG